MNNQIVNQISKTQEANSQKTTLNNGRKTPSYTLRAIKEYDKKLKKKVISFSKKKDVDLIKEIDTIDNFTAWVKNKLREQMNEHS